MAEQEFDALRPEDRPQDSSGDGEGLRFTTHEHDEMNMPQAIEVMDPEGRWAVCTARTNRAGPDNVRKCPVRVHLH